MNYKNYQRNYAIPPGREQALDDFINQTYEGTRHKLKHKSNSNSEDALTWSCFEALKQLPPAKRNNALNEIFQDAYQNENMRLPGSGEQAQIYIGKEYTGTTTKETTEVDASIEWPGALVFFEAKLYSTVSVAELPDKPHDQIAKKLRVGLDAPLGDVREFFFIFLDIAPCKKIYQRKSKQLAKQPNDGYHNKWKSAWWFDYYKNGRNNSMRPLADALDGIDAPPVDGVAANMGWLTWADLFKSILRGMV